MSAAPDEGTAYSLDFVRSSLPPAARRILEVGCGNGELAAALAGAGLEVVAIDSDVDAVANARDRGVDARLAEWPDFEEGRFDSVLFTRSLHHVGRLEQSVAAAFAASSAGGRVIVEDFRAEGAGERGEAWFQSLVMTLSAGGLLTEPTPYLRQRLGESPPHDHGEQHQLHSSTTIESALRSAGSAVQARDSAYYFRYLLPALAGSRLGPALLRHELELIAAGLIDPLGRRFVAERPTG